MKKIIAFLFVFSLYSHIQAQTLYQRAIYGMSLFYAKGCVTSDGGFIVIGQKNTTPSDEDIFLIKLDGNGDTLWTRTYLYSNNFDDVQEVLQTKDGGLFVVAWNYVIKTDSMGFPLWAKTISLSGNSLGKTAIETPAGELVIASRASNNLWSDEGVQLTKLDSAGNVIFNKVIGIFQGPYPYSIKNTSDGGYIIAGETAYASNATDAFLMKTDSAGNVNWAHHYGSNSSDGFWGVEQTANGDYLAIGGTTSPQETFLIKVDSIGVLIWSRVYHSGFSMSMGYMITKTSDQNFVFCGNIQNPDHASVIGKIDENGTVLWTKAYHPGIQSNGSRFYGVYEAADGCLIATGSYIEVPWDGFNYVVKCDSAGNSNCFSSNLSWTSTPFVSKDSAIVCITANGFIANVTIQSECFCDSSHLICTSNVGIDETNHSNASLIIYPNPFFEKLNIELNNSEISEVLLYDIAAKILLQQKFANSVTLNTEQLAKGLYIYEVRCKDGSCKKGKVVKY